MEDDEDEDDYYNNDNHTATTDTDTNSEDDSHRNDDDDGNNNDTDDGNNNDTNPSDDQSDEEDEDEYPAVTAGVTTTRSGRVINPPSRYTLAQNEDTTYQYETADTAPLAIIMSQIQEKVYATGYLFAETFSLNKGIKQFGDRAKEAAIGEMKQLHDRVVFEPVDVPNTVYNILDRS
jgi:hypothetical protein